MPTERAIKPEAARPPCIYCGNPTTGVAKGEHVVPAALHVNQTLRCVCPKCNGGFSELDTELTSRSPLGVLVRSYFGARGELSWGYDAQHNVALEARALPGFVGCPVWPQLVILAEKELFAFDYGDLRTVDVDRLQTAFWEHLTDAIRATEQKPKSRRFVWQSIIKGPDRGHFPPRVYTEHCFDEFKPGMQFKCRYLAGEDRNQIMERVRRWRPPKNGRLESELCTANLKSLSRYRPAFVLRDLVKIGVNLLAHLSGPEAVNRKTFHAATRYVLTGSPPEPRPDRNGFVVNDDMRQLGCPPDCHRFALRHDGVQWIGDFAFFEGKLGARISIPGPRVGDWYAATVTTPFRGNDRAWDYQRTSIITLPPRMRVDWEDTLLLMPSVPQIQKT